MSAFLVKVYARMELNLDAGVCTCSSSESGTTSSNSDSSDVPQSVVTGLKPYRFELVISKNNDRVRE